VINAINLPRLEVPVSGKPRVAVIYKGAAADQVAKLAPGKLNKAEKGEIGYAIIELDSTPAADLAGKLEGVPGVLKARVI